MNAINSLKGFFKFLITKLKRKKVIIRGECLRCGICCRKINICDYGQWISSEKQFQQVCREEPGYKRFIITGKNQYGVLNFSCSWIQEDGSCKDYPNRLDICKYYPDENMIYRNGVVSEHCGYVVELSQPFEKVLQKTIRKDKRKQKWVSFKKRFSFKQYTHN